MNRYNNKKWAVFRSYLPNARIIFQKLLFVDDEADVSNCGDPAAAAAIADSSGGTSSSHDDDEFDSSFIDDDQDKAGPSTSMTKQYLRSVKYAHSFKQI